ncbi:hypothetical protein N480_09700 [Pseudoalteromonas luteoviolacea S2607]|uniref:antitoxin Xre/MbcA/ParS toxin-binding domain-containing protein n=1 Tax=Pseudoalteromonas luteoviolacea TaxID=43657 RepID=UPI0007B0A6AD|nr:antitoxin Xre/MbcA/ParS toxin-binding domain-containing protein [Pseudoalteromonas luteoviolacea]KZN29032.1 hypothetical protein N480_09700 [Pseudoalteromonas luteoviolacea S2607]
MVPENHFERLTEKCPEIRSKLLKMFKTEEQALKWLKQPKWQLGDQAPLSCLDTNPNLILELIDQINRGDFS